MRMLLVAAQRGMVDQVVQAVTAVARADGSGPDPVRDGALGGRDRCPLDLEEGVAEEAIVDASARTSPTSSSTREGDPIRPDPAEAVAAT